MSCSRTEPVARPFAQVRTRVAASTVSIAFARMHARAHSYLTSDRLLRPTVRLIRLAEIAGVGELARRRWGLLHSLYTLRAHAYASALIPTSDRTLPCAHGMRGRFSRASAPLGHIHSFEHRRERGNPFRGLGRTTRTPAALALATGSRAPFQLLPRSGRQPRTSGVLKRARDGCRRTRR
jgi:hypothetical protein